MAKAKKAQTCPVCEREISPEEEIALHPSLRRWVHPDCAKKGGEKVAQESDLKGLLEGLTPPQRGIFAPPQTEEEQKQSEVLNIQANLTRTLQIIVESMPYVHPDWLLSSLGELSGELKDLTRLYYAQNVFSSIDKIFRLHDLLIAHQEKIAKDAGVEVPAPMERFKLDEVLRGLAERAGAITRR